MLLTLLGARGLRTGRIPRLLALLVLSAFLFVTGCKGEKSDDEKSGGESTESSGTEGESERSAASSGESNKAGSRKASNNPSSSEPAVGSAETKTSAADQNADQQEALNTLRRHMRKQVSPHFGKPDSRENLVTALRQVPALAPEPFKERFQTVIDAMPEEGSLAPTCKTCHVQHRLDFRNRKDLQPK